MKDVQKDYVITPEDEAKIATFGYAEDDVDTFMHIFGKVLTPEELNDVVQKLQNANKHPVNVYSDKFTELLNQHKRSGGATFDKGRVDRFIQTFLYVASLDFRAKMVNMNDYNYLLSDFKVHASFTPFALPRGVYANVGVEFIRLDESYLLNDVEPMNPTEFMLFQEEVLSKFRVKDISWNSDLDSLTQPITISESLDRLGDIELGCVHTSNINEVTHMPIFGLDVAEDFYYDAPFSVYFDNLYQNIISDLHNR